MYVVYVYVFARLLPLCIGSCLSYEVVALPKLLPNSLSRISQTYYSTMFAVRRRFAYAYLTNVAWWMWEY